MIDKDKVFILSPHIDDAAFSLALAIDQLTGNGINVTILNCFTVTQWTAVPVENKEIKAVSQMRKSEDEAFYKAIRNVEIINLDLLDAPLRNGYIFQDQPFVQNELQLINELEKLVEKLVNGLLICPLAIGNHIDHAICRQAVASLYRKLKVVFYEDLPYARRLSEGRLQQHVHDLEAQLNAQFNHFIVRSGRSTLNKENAVRIYESQVNDVIVSEIAAHETAIGGERIWGVAEDLDTLNSLIAG